jgi:hypothetical protein
LIGGVVGLFFVPLRDPVALKGILDFLTVTVVALAFGDVLMRIGAARRGRSTGLFEDTPEGRLSARYAARGQADTNLGRLGTAAIALFSLVAAVWMPGVAALAAIASALVCTVLAKAGAQAVLRGSRLSVLWYSLTFVGVCATVGLSAAQLGA